MNERRITLTLPRIPAFHDASVLYGKPVTVRTMDGDHGSLITLKIVGVGFHDDSMQLELVP